MIVKFNYHSRDALHNKKSLSPSLQFNVTWLTIVCWRFHFMFFIFLFSAELNFNRRLYCAVCFDYITLPRLTTHNSLESEAKCFLNIWETYRKRRNAKFICKNQFFPFQTIWNWNFPTLLMVCASMCRSEKFIKNAYNIS